MIVRRVKLQTADAWTTELSEELNYKQQILGQKDCQTSYITNHRYLATWLSDQLNYKPQILGQH